MPEINYRRNVEQLRELASIFWPEEISSQEATLSVIPTLVQTQDEFLSILKLNLNSLDSLFRTVSLSRVLYPNLFLKHLVVLSDLGGEMLMRINTNFASFFPDGVMEYLKNGSTQTYEFKALPIRGSLNNDKLSISGNKLFTRRAFDNLIKDVCAILIYGSSCTDEEIARKLSNCEIGNYLGKADNLEKYVKQRYIWVSRITRGATANNLGQLAQDYVKDFIQDNIGFGVTVVKNGTMPGVAHTEDGRLTSFDIVVSKNNRYVAVEVSFQVTTNSVIERKAGQAQSRHAQAASRGYKIAYVIDGAGNFQRETALRTICENSDCTVAFSIEELEVLCQFIRTYLG